MNWKSEKGKWERDTEVEVWQLDEEWIHWDVSRQGVYRGGELVLNWGQLTASLNVGSNAALEDLPCETMTIDADIVVMPSGRFGKFRIISEDKL